LRRPSGVAERRGPVQRCLALRAAVSHETARFHRFLRHAIRIRAIRQQNLQHQVVCRVAFAQRRVQGCFSCVLHRKVHVRAAFDQELAQAPVPVEARADQPKIVAERIERRSVRK
jgi:hypothetical protein